MDAAPFTPPRAHKIAAAVVALLLIGSLARSFLRPQPAVSTPENAAPESTPSPSPERAPVRIDFEVQAEVRPGEPAPPLRLRIRTRDGVQPAFDVTSRDEPVKARCRLPFPLPVARPELPLRGEVVGGAWCIPPGQVEFEVTRLDTPFQLPLARAHAFDAVVATEDGRPLAGARIVHESAKPFGTTAADGHAALVVALAREAPVLIAQADGCASAWVDAAAPTVLRATSKLGRLRGVVRDAQGGAIANASLFPHWSPAGASPTDAAGAALWRLAQWTTKRNVPALALTSDAAGRFEVPIAFPGRVRFSVQHREFGATTAEFALDEKAATAGATTDVEIRFPRRVALTVTLTQEGRAVARGRVELVVNDGGAAAPLAAGVADAKGVVEIVAPDVPGLFLVARGDAAAAHVEPFAAGGRGAVSIEVALANGRAATFTFAGTEAIPVAAQPLEARDHESGALLETAVTDASGRGRFKRLPLGRALDLVAPALASPSPLRAAVVVEAVQGDLDLGTFELKRD